MDQNNNNQPNQTTVPQPMGGQPATSAQIPPANTAMPNIPPPAVPDPLGSIPPPPPPSSETMNTANPQVYNNSKGDKKMLFLILLVVIMAITVGGLYFFLIKSSPAVDNSSVVPTTAPTAIPTITPTPTPNLDVNSLDIGDPQTDIDSINSEVNQL